MYFNHKEEITVVIPVLNEEEAIGIVINNVIEEGYKHILVVDGHSTDRTYHIAKKNGIEVILQNGEGKTGAIESAINFVRTPYFVVMDGDCTYHPKDIKKFYPELLTSKQVIGSRIRGKENIPFINRFGNFIINAVFNLFFKTNIIDVCSGMYLLHTQFAKSLSFKTRGFDVEVEIAAQAARRGIVSEVPINYYPRVGTQKLSPLKDGIQIFLSILKLAIQTSAKGVG